MWNFKVIERGIPERNPRETEFFRLRSPAETVIREFIQNSLDARRNQETIEVKISLIRVERERIRSFLADDLKEHLIACGMLADCDYPENVPCLILEDFGTTGLDGEFTPDAGQGNFYNFWWREGVSQKREQRAGRWGLGKITFHVVSKIRTFFGLTVREDKRTLLMGKALLKTHLLHDQRYQYFGYFSMRDYMPVENGGIISEFKNKFGIARNTEAGLSLVIILPVDEINFDSLQKAVIEHYFYPVLAGSLKVEVRESDRQEELNGSNLIEKASAIDWRDTDWEGINIREVLEFIRGAENIQIVSLQVENLGSPDITQKSFGDQLDIIKTSFRSGEPVKFKVPLRIRKSDGNKSDTSFTVLLKRFPGLGKTFECYIRSGIFVSEIKMLGSRPIAGLLIADDKAVCEFLGDCETPAHTSWNERTEGFAEKYTNAARILRFIKKSMAQIVSIIDEPPRDRQIDFLKEIFSVPVSPEQRGEEQEITQEPEVSIDERSPTVFAVSQLQGGFSITLNPRGTGHLSFPFRATVKMAYNTFRGDPFSGYEKFDFDVGGASISIEGEDCNIIERNLNQIKVQITGLKFKLQVKGFDNRRDLVIDIK